jgi:hypothetical protein
VGPKSMQDLVQMRHNYGAIPGRIVENSWRFVLNQIFGFRPAA